ncbi:MAG: ABC transporter permease, partial [Chloroflexi bacterium]|nr:ABC transporter permease [Chloroflexota bacterium]
ITNGLFIVLLLCSGIIFPLDVLPAPLRVGAQLLPAAPLAGLLRSALGPEPLAAGTVLAPLAVLTAWAVAAPWVAARVFRWE